MSSEPRTYRVEELIRAGLLEIGDGYRAKNSELAETGIPFARAGNINDGFKFDGADFFPESELSRVGSKISRPGDVVFTSKGTVGRFAFVEQHSQRFVYSPQLCFWRSLDSENILPEYLYYWMSSQEFLHQVSYLKGQTDMADYVSLRDQRRMAVTIPSIQQQRHVVDCLKPIDERITLLRETSATLEAIAQALFKSWFVDFDPVHSNSEGLEPEGMDAATAALFPDSFEESELGLMPRGWKMSTLGAICELNGGVIQTGPFGSQLHASDYVAEGVPVVMPKDISDRRVDVTTAARILPEDVDRLSRHQLRGGDIVFSRRGDVEKHALIGETEHGWLCGTGCLLVRPGTRRKVSGYLSRSLDLQQTKQWLTQHAVGATMPNLNTGILSAVPVLLPTDEILASFEQVASVFDESISESNATAQILTELRDTLLPRLIFGQMRLPETEASIKNMLSEAI